MTETATGAGGRLTIDVVSDTICPWCYIGKRRLEQALAMRPDVEAEVRWRPFQLDPTIPRGGVDRQQYLENKFGGPERAREIYGRIEAAADAEGLEVDFGRIARTPNTIDSHRLIRWAASTGRQSDVVEDLFRHYFSEGGDIEDPQVLTAIAETNGIDGDLIAELLAGDADRDLVEKEIALAQQLGVTGVPCFILADRFGVVGAQSPETLAEAIDRARVEAPAE
ncbi:DsbA family oxidoreductase [Lutibaculum baratangense]|uniref:2-hydroxychromene-2-carboxylate isomerase/DsbA-like thioredoxin n=1 Tax=Lutibaculum baratangense AMV1 TaxID=631454 RepID=V4TL86_9HYPH|nr:DsbA family oxidoreductase [Lutibaculum baratangense]ESR26583.1 2-hydroxychromene-2-carboxylate isomerase/DsbA-like thioredoxin [Lutibaculum baratangense AMV1]